MYSNSYYVVMALITFIILVLVFLVLAVIILLINKSNNKKELMDIKRQINYLFIARKSQDTPAHVQPTQNIQPVAKSVIPSPVIESPIIETKAEKTSVNYESLFGRNVVGIAAAILVFIGLIFLGILIYKYIPETGKIIAMYLISAIITGLGYFLSKKFNNTFTQILTGCGMGCFFISILLTHVYFNKIQDITAFSLLLIWLIITLAVSKFLSSLLINIVAHIGMLISICFAYYLGLSDEKLVLLLIYQIVAIIIITVGNILCCRQAYRFGLFVSLIMTIIGSTFMWKEFIQDLHYTLRQYTAFNSQIPTGGIVTAFALQFLCVAFLSYLISISTNKIKKNPYFVLVHIANKLLFLWALMLNIYNVIYRVSLENLSGSGEYERSLFYAVLGCIIILFIHGILTLMLSKHFNFSRILENCSVIIITSFSVILLLIFYFNQYNVIIFYPHLTWLIIISLILFVGYFISRNNAYKISAYIVLGLDVLYMIFDGYEQLNKKVEIWLPLLYVIIISAGVFFEWFVKEIKYKKLSAITYKTIMFFFIELSLFSIFSGSSLNYWNVILLLILSAFNIVLFYIRYDQKSGQGASLKLLMHINEIILIIFSVSYIASTPKNQSETILSSILTLFILMLSFMRIKDIITVRQNGWIYIWTGIKFTIIVLTYINGITTWFDYVYIFSIVSMLTALACVCFGFFIKAKSIRLYGLIITLVCVIKLVTFDVSSANTILRVTALIGGGIICFAISALYTYMEKRITK